MMMVFTADFHSNESSDLGHHKACLMTQITCSSWLSSVSCLVAFSVSDMVVLCSFCNGMEIKSLKIYNEKKMIDNIWLSKFFVHFPRIPEFIRMPRECTGWKYLEMLYDSQLTYVHLEKGCLNGCFFLWYHLCVACNFS